MCSTVPPVREGAGAFNIWGSKLVLVLEIKFFKKTVPIKSMFLKETVLIVIIMPGGPFYRALGHLNSSSYGPFLGWFGPVRWPLGPSQSSTMLFFGVGSPNDFSLAFFTQIKVMECPKYGFVTLPTPFSCFCHIVKPPGLFRYQDIISFVR